MTLSGYMRFWGYVFAAVTLAIWLLKKEAPEEEEQQEGGHGRSGGSKAANSMEEGHGGQEEAKGGNGSGSGVRVKRKRSNTTPLTAEERQLLTGDQQGSAATTGDGGEESSGRGRSVGAELVGAYVQLWRVVKLPAVWQLTALLLTYRLGVLAAEGAASLKLIDKGVAKEALAFLVLFQVGGPHIRGWCGQWVRSWGSKAAGLVGGLNRGYD